MARRGSCGCRTRSVGCWQRRRGVCSFKRPWRRPTGQQGPEYEDVQMNDVELETLLDDLEGDQRPRPPLLVLRSRRNHQSRGPVRASYSGELRAAGRQRLPQPAPGRGHALPRLRPAFRRGQPDCSRRAGPQRQPAAGIPSRFPLGRSHHPSQTCSNVMTDRPWLRTKRGCGNRAACSERANGRDCAGSDGFSPGRTGRHPSFSEGGSVPFAASGILC